MILSSVQLKNFRSHKDKIFRFSDKINYIVGGNGQGKTSVLESVYYLCTTKSCSSKSDSEAVRFKENDFEIKGSFRNYPENDVRIFFSLEQNRKYYFKDNKQISKTSEIIGKFPVVILTPADHSITQGSPADRRKFVDSVISQASETYFKNILDYNRTLRQRSSLLVQIKENRNAGLLREFDAWSQKLLETGTEIILQRKKFMAEFQSYIRESYSNIMNSSEVPGVAYSFLEDYSGTEISERFAELLAERKDEELRRAVNLVGPQRDDFIFEINGVNLRTFGSQGQHKTFQVVLRFAEYFYLKEVTGTTPIFLLDDVFGELDAERSAKISRCLRSVGQAFITITDLANFSFLQKTGEDKVIRLNNGNVIYE